MTDGKVGVASADVQLNVGSNEETTAYPIRVVLSGGYYGSEEDITVVTVSKPVNAGAIMGAGKIENIGSVGLIKGADTHFTSFSYDVRYNKKSTNPQGKMTFVVKSWYNKNGILDGVSKPHTYIIKTNAVNLFIIGPNNAGLAKNQAIFDAKANISECIDGTLVTVDGNSPIHITMTDNGTEGAIVDGKYVFDKIGITYYNNSGGLFYANKWDGKTHIEQDVLEGDVVVCSTTTKSAEIATAIEPEIVAEPGLKVYPNPFSDRLRFEFVAPEAVNARIDIMDMTGRLVKTIFEQPVEGGVSYEAEFRPEAEVSAMYIYRMVMGDAVYNGKVTFKK
jgi:hypothetical protein